MKKEDELLGLNLKEESEEEYHTVEEIMVSDVSVEFEESEDLEAEDPAICDIVVPSLESLNVKDDEESDASKSDDNNEQSASNNEQSASKRQRSKRKKGQKLSQDDVVEMKSGKKTAVKGAKKSKDSTGLKCASCKESFPSRNKLFDHLKTTGHSAPLSK